MKNILFGYSLLLLIAITACTKKDTSSAATPPPAAPVDIAGKWTAGIQTDTWTGGGLRAPYTTTTQMPLPAWEFTSDGRLLMKGGDISQTASYRTLASGAIVLSTGKVMDTMELTSSGSNSILLKVNRRFANGQQLEESLQLSKN